MSRNQLRLMKFLLKFPRDWHGIGPDSRRCARNLASLGLLEWNEERKQARLALGESARLILDNAK